MANPTTITGYDLNAAAGRCFIAMLQSDQWYGQAALKGGSDPQGLLTALATFAIMAAQTIEAQVTATISKY